MGTFCDYFLNLNKLVFCIESINIKNKEKFYNNSLSILQTPLAKQANFLYTLIDEKAEKTITCHILAHASTGL